jgi:hypothetical protein
VCTSYWTLACLFAMASVDVSAQDIIKVSRPAWDGLSSAERASIQSTKIVEARDVGTYGTIVDNQGVDESTPGTTSGAALGAAMGRAAYIDHAFKPNNDYSAKNQVGATILGAIIGSTLDKPAVQRFHFLYAVKLADGEIKFLDTVQGNAFRHPAGLCVSVPDLAQLPQSVCNYTAADLRRAYLPADVIPAASTHEAVKLPLAASASVADRAVTPGGVVTCKLGNLQPISTTAEKCNAIGGTVL